LKGGKRFFFRKLLISKVITAMHIFSLQCPCVAKALPTASFCPCSTALGLSFMSTLRASIRMCVSPCVRGFAGVPRIGKIHHSYSYSYSHSYSHSYSYTYPPCSDSYSRSHSRGVQLTWATGCCSISCENPFWSEFWPPASCSCQLHATRMWTWIWIWTWWICVRIWMWIWMWIRIWVWMMNFTNPRYTRETSNTRWHTHSYGSA
jgi:hypothetical protein